MVIERERFDLAGYVTPKELYSTPICKWFVFPHSYGITLVNAILERVKAGNENVVWDPCIGAGTTLVACRAKGIPAIGTDILPLSLIITKAKTRSYSTKQLKEAFISLERLLGKRTVGQTETDILLMNRAFPPEVVARAHQIISDINNLNVGLRPFFLTALLRCFSDFGAFSRDGGWPRLTDKPKESAERLDILYSLSVEDMIQDVRSQQEYFARRPNLWKVYLADMRRLRSKPRVDFVITSPPYLNKHDYTRIFTPELTLSGIDSNSKLINLRYKTMRSHVEAKRPTMVGPTVQMKEVTDILDKVKSHFGNRSSIVTMIAGYLEDLYIFLKRCSYKLSEFGYICLVLSNVQFDGIEVPIDELIDSMSNILGLQLEEQWILRYRGNSSQQMAKYKRNPSREYALFIKKVAR